MIKVNQHNSQITNKRNDGPTIKELELLLIRIEQLDQKRYNKSKKTTKSNRAA